MASKAWTENEIDPAIALYFDMLGNVLEGRPMNKRAMIRAAQGATVAAGYKIAYGPLGGRTRQSVECKLMNITACCIDLGWPSLSMSEHGYRPLHSYQALLKERVAVAIEVMQTVAEVQRNHG